MNTASLHRRITALAVLICMCITCIMPAMADEYPTQVKTVAEAYVVYDVNSGQVIMSKDMDTSRAPASITKIMTALLVCENVEDFSQTITFTQAALDEMTETSSDLTPRAVVGETMTVENVLYGMFLSSANECAAQLAITVGGSREAFAEMMNKRAEEIGCTGTHFVNAHGLDNENHYTTPHDMALIFAEALKNEKFYKMATTVDYVIPATNMCVVERECQMGHKMVSGLIEYAEVFAGKTGNTHEAGRTLATAAKFGDRTVITVIMHSTEASFYDDTTALLEYARGYYAGKYSDMSWKNLGMDMTVRVPNTLAVRDYPSTQGSSVLARLDDGNIVHVNAVWSNWAAITFNGQTAYVCTDYLVDSTGQTLPAETYDNSVVETEPETTTASETETVPEGIKDLGETTVAAETTASAENEKGAGGNVFLAVILIALIVIAALVAIAFIVRKAISEERELYRDYYKDNDKLFYDDDDEDDGDGDNEDSEDEAEDAADEDEGISDEDALFLDDDELYDDMDDSENDEESDDEAEDDDAELDDAEDTESEDADDLEDDSDDDLDDDVDAENVEVAAGGDEEVAAGGDEEVAGADDDLEDVEVADMDDEELDDGAEDYDDSSDNASDDASDDDSADDFDETEGDPDDTEVADVDDGDTDLDGEDEEAQEPLDAEDAGKAYVQALLRGEAVHATARKIKRDKDEN